MPASFTEVEAAALAPLVTMMEATDRWDAVRAARTWVLEQAGPGGTRPSLDVGCGPGTFGAAARRTGRRVVDVDRSAPMLAVARARSAGAPATVADVARLPFRDGSAELVRCERTLQWTADPGRALQELWRVTGDGGLLAVTDTDWGSLVVHAPERWMTEALGAAALGWVPHPRLASTLADRLGALRSASVARREDVVVVDAWDPADPSQADGPPGLPLHSIAAGATEADRDAVDRALDAVAAAAHEGVFRAELRIITVVARR
ncbi:MAG: methyltransferase domain-containing protein [Ilumatobacteraceae bacterium]